MFCVACGSEVVGAISCCPECGEVVGTTKSTSKESVNKEFKAFASVFYDWGKGYFRISPAGWLFFAISLLVGISIGIDERTATPIPFCLIPFIILRTINETKWKSFEKAAGRVVKINWKNLELNSN